MPYAAAALADYLGNTPDQACSDKTARSMAMAAFVRAQQLAGRTQSPVLFGLGVSAALATDRVRKGQDRAYVCIQTLSHTWEFHLSLDPERTEAQGSREHQEQLLTEYILNTLNAALLAAEPPQAPRQTDVSEQRVTAGEKAWQELLLGKRDWAGSAEPKALFPGAFNPLHQGHEQMIQVAEAKLGCPVTLEISAFNVDKPPLDYFDIQQRQDQIQGRHPLVITRAPTFLEKSAMFPGIPFVVGLDTLVRIAHNRYYGHDNHRRDSAISSLAERGNSFLVFGRQLDQAFETLDDVSLPDRLMQLCTGVSEADFRQDISSTELRQKGLSNE